MFYIITFLFSFMSTRNGIWSIQITQEIVHVHTHTHMNKATKNVHTKSSVKETTKSQNECIPQLYTNLSIAYIMSDQCFCKVSNIWSKTVMHHVRTTTFQGHFWHCRDSKNWSTIACSTSSRDCVIKVRIKSSKGSSPDRNCGTLCKVVGPRWSVMRSWL